MQTETNYTVLTVNKNIHTYVTWHPIRVDTGNTGIEFWQYSTNEICCWLMWSWSLKNSPVFYESRKMPSPVTLTYLCFPTFQKSLFTLVLFSSHVACWRSQILKVSERYSWICLIFVIGLSVSSWSRFFWTLAKSQDNCFGERKYVYQGAWQGWWPACSPLEDLFCPSARSIDWEDNERRRVTAEFIPCVMTITS